MNVSPVGAGTVTSPNFSTPTVVTDSEEYTCSTSYRLTAVPNSSDNYVFYQWGGSVSGSTNPINVSVAGGSKNVTAYFMFKTEPVNLQGVKDLLDGDNDALVIDVSSSSQFAVSHMLCARNYIWVSGANAFFTSITNLNPYKKSEILIYDQAGTLSEAAANYLAGQGFESVSYMTDSLTDWEDAGYDTFMTGNYPGGDSDICTGLAPIAYAGEDKSVNENQKVTLNGPPGSGLAYEWIQAKGDNNVTIADSSSQNATFTAPDLDAGDDTLVFHLTVTDLDGKTDTDSLAVAVKWINEAPTANAGPKQTVSSGTLVTLNGSGTDPDNSTLSYQWTWLQGTISPTLANSATATPSFTAPTTSGWVIYELTVTDNGGLTDTDTVQVVVQAEVVDPNDPPEANAGTDQTVTEGQAVTLDGSGSTDSDGTIASYAWTQTGTPAVTLSDPSSAQPIFTAPNVDSATDLMFNLTVIDNDGDPSTDSVTVTVNDDGIPVQNEAPTADAGDDQSVKEDKTVTLDGSGSTDSDGTIASYAWTQTDSTGITVALSNASVAKPTFTSPDIDASTTLTFSLIVTDNEGDSSASDTVFITVTESSGGGGGGGGCFIESLVD